MRVEHGGVEHALVAPELLTTLIRGTSDRQRIDHVLRDRVSHRLHITLDEIGMFNRLLLPLPAVEVGDASVTPGRQVEADLVRGITSCLTSVSVDRGDHPAGQIKVLPPP